MYTHIIIIIIGTTTISKPAIHDHYATISIMLIMICNTSTSLSLVLLLCTPGPRRGIRQAGGPA